MENFTPIASLIGGIIIGASALGLMAFNGQVAGITGVTRGVLQPKGGDVAWRIAFLAGLIVGPAVYQAITGNMISPTITKSVPVLVIGGLMVGFGTTMGSGCTSGHGVCGLGRLSIRSLAATMTFMVTAVATVYIARHVVGGIG